MKKIILLVIVSFVIAPMWLNAQENNYDEINSLIEKSKKEEKKSDSGPTISSGDNTVDSTYKASAARRFPNVSGYYSECYEHITTKYGLWQGIGEPLNAVQRRHTVRYYKLLRPKNAPANSPFTHMQIVNSYGKLTTDHTYGPILGNPFSGDKGLSYKWKYKLEDVCQSEQIVAQGMLVQENLYDANGELILQYVPTYPKKNCVFGHYTDPSGLLAHLREDEDAAYISMEFDKNGHISRVAFTDEEGQLKRNDDGAFVQVFEYDKKGNMLCSQSADALGQPMIDNWGNSGWRYTYDKQGRILTATCIDQNGQPMRMPDAKSTNDVWSIRYTYDDYGNELTCSYYDLYGRTDTTSKGVHRYVYIHDDHGNTISCRGEDLKYQLVNYSNDVAQWERRYDDEGHLLMNVQRNKDGLFSTTGDCVSLFDYSKGIRVRTRTYESSIGTDTTLNYMTVYHPEADTLWNYYSDYLYIERYDKKHRTISQAYYDLDLNPIILYGGWHKCVNEYIDSPQHSINIEKYFAPDGSLVDINSEDFWRGCNKKITEVDSITRTIIYSEWDGDKLLEKYQNTWDENYQNPIVLSYYDKIGTRGRTSMADAFYYEMERVRDPRGNIIVWRSLNEFGEPAYTQFGDWDNANLYCYYVNGDDYYYDENGDTISNYSEDKLKFKDSLNKSFCIELTDSCAYNYGLRTGDVIVRYGDWYYVEPETQYINYCRNMLCYETVIKASVPKTITVMRHDPITKTSRLIDVELPAGTPQQLGFQYHIHYLTTREAEHFNEVIAVSKKFKDVDTYDKNESNDRVDFVYPHKIGSDSSKDVYTSGLCENSILLGWEVYADDDVYFFSCHNKQIDIDKAFSYQYDSVAMHYTVDGKTAKRFVFKDNYFRYDMTRVYSLVTDGSMIYALADSLQAAFDEQHPRFCPSLTPHEAADMLLNYGAELESDNGEGFAELGLGDITGYEKIVFTKLDASYHELFMVNDILLNIDYSDYINFINYDYEICGHVNNEKIDEFAWHNVENKSISFLYGDLKFDPKYAAVLTVDEDLNSSVKKGDYIILKCENWNFGMDDANLTEAFENKNEISQITIAKIVEKKDKYKLNPNITLTMSPVEWGKVNYNWKEVPDPIVFEAVKQMKRKK